MKHIFAVEDAAQLSAYQASARRFQPRLEAYLQFLAEEYQVRELPRAIVWTSMEAATRLLSDIPVPAYTNDYRVMFCPEADVWREIWLHQLDGVAECAAAAEIRAYYETALNDDCLLSILGHELAHHCPWFPDFDDEEAREAGIWFEEGMVEYIGRRYFLTDAEFEAEARVNRLLTELLEPRYGSRSLEDFGAATYEGGDYAGIFFNYWRSFLAVEALVGRLGGVQAVFDAYRRWCAGDREKPLAEWFELE